MAVVVDIQRERQLRDREHAECLVERGQFAKHGALLAPAVELATQCSYRGHTGHPHTGRLGPRRRNQHLEHRILELHLPRRLADDRRWEIAERRTRCVAAPALVQERGRDGWVQLHRLGELLARPAQDNHPLGVRHEVALLGVWVRHEWCCTRCGAAAPTARGLHGLPDARARDTTGPVADIISGAVAQSPVELQRRLDAVLPAAPAPAWGGPRDLAGPDCSSPLRGRDPGL